VVPLSWARPAGFEPATDGVGDLPGLPDHRHSLIVILSSENTAQLRSRLIQDHDGSPSMMPITGNKAGNGFPTKLAER
jgi:hypothetical protein